jgi:allose kinase
VLRLKHIMSATIVIDMGGTSVRFGHLLNQQPVAMGLSLPTSELRESSTPLSWLAQQVKTYALEKKLRASKLVIGVPFTPDKDRTTALSSPNIRNLEGAPIKAELQQHLGIEVILERDINLLLLGEWYAGAAKGAGDVLGMFVGTGIGGSFLQGGVPYRGASHCAIELGHIPIRAEGRRCVCGNIDCLEAYACGHTLITIAEEEKLAVSEIFSASGSPSLTPKRTAFVRDLAYGLATAINLFQPDVALMGGGIPEMKDFPKEEFKTIFLEHLRRPVPHRTITLRWASLGSEAALWGALALP